MTQNGNWKQRLKDSRFVQHSKLITGSATFALFLSIAFFVFETIDSKKDTLGIVNELTVVKNSLSTRYLGLFPQYIDGGNGIIELLNEAYKSYSQPDASGELHPIDTIIVFEDVLYYGIKSCPQGFRKMNEMLIRLANKGCAIFIAYYSPHGSAFNQMVREGLISQKHMADYNQDINSIYRAMPIIKHDQDSLLQGHWITQQVKDSIDKELFKKHIASYINLEELRQRNILSDVESKSFGKQDSIIDGVKQLKDMLCELYYQKSYEDAQKDYQKKRREYLRSSYMPSKYTDAIEEQSYLLAHMIDSIKTLYLKQENVHFIDYKNMYISLTQNMLSFYEQKGYGHIHMLALNDYLTMSCWTICGKNRHKSIFAFPSKYSTEEIGFVSQDEAIASYVRTMLQGVMGQNNRTIENH